MLKMKRCYGESRDSMKCQGGNEVGAAAHIGWSEATRDRT